MDLGELVPVIGSSMKTGSNSMPLLATDSCVSAEKPSELLVAGTTASPNAPNDPKSAWDVDVGHEVSQ